MARHLWVQTRFKTRASCRARRACPTTCHRWAYHIGLASTCGGATGRAWPTSSQTPTHPLTSTPSRRRRHSSSAWRESKRRTALSSRLDLPQGLGRERLGPRCRGLALWDPRWPHRDWQALPASQPSRGSMRTSTTTMVQGKPRQARAWSHPNQTGFLATDKLSWIKLIRRSTKMPNLAWIITSLSVLRPLPITLTNSKWVMTKSNKICQTLRTHTQTSNSRKRSWRRYSLALIWTLIMPNMAVILRAIGFWLPKKHQLKLKPKSVWSLSSRMEKYMMFSCKPKQTKMF